MPASLHVALAGNPNCGKTALFNALTGSRQKVGNWPGVTVERKCGNCRCDKAELKVVDLPGTYSLAVTSEAALDERIACEYLLGDEVDVVVNVIDGSNLERNLYLTLQLLEMGKPVVLAVNMMDVVESRGLHIDFQKLGKQLGCDVVGIVANKQKGMPFLLQTIVEANKKHQSSFALQLDPIVKKARKGISQLLHKQAHADWLALRLLEGDEFATAQVDACIQQNVLLRIKELTKELAEEPDILIADARYQFAHQLVEQSVSAFKTQRQTVTDVIDKVVLNRFLGIPIFLFVMYLMFLFAINVGGAFQDFFDIGSTTILVDGVAHWMTQLHSPMWLTAIIANGIGKGINTTITFIPVIGAMFLFLSFLEDSGYMARAAFVMDRLMQMMGLPGRSFVPMIVGFGCNVPAVMGARTLSNRRDRILTVMMMPFMSCGARLAIFAVFASAFFPQGGQNIIFLLYITGIVVAMLTGLILRKTVLTGESSPMIMELPQYHMPLWGSLWRHMWQRLKHFLKRASKVIIPVCMLIGVLNTITITGQLSHGEANQQSLLSEVGRVVTPILEPMGVKQDNWPATVGLVTGVLAKEVVVGTLNTLYSDVGHLTQHEADDFNLTAGLKAAVMSVPENLKALPQAVFNPILADEAPHDMDHAVYGIMYQQFGGSIEAFCYLLFVLLYFPCISTLAVMKREVGNGWAYFSMLWSTVGAYGIAVLAYQAMTWSDHPLMSALWIASVVITFAIAVLCLRLYAMKPPSKEVDKHVATN
ncbi:MAG: Fe(2+) transporter permease subunit FeoB [Coxiellaceae bacterium]|nr:Fe(2+) transporter permease subunit FeoB [Coxiellaceae bacterium]